MRAQRGKQGGDGVDRHERPGCIVHEHDVRRGGGKRAKPCGHAGLPGLTARHGWQNVQAFECRIDELCVANREQGGHMGQQRLRRMPDHGFARYDGELLGGSTAEAAARTGGDQESGDTHDGRNARRGEARQWRRMTVLPMRA